MTEASDLWLELCESLMGAGLEYIDLGRSIPLTITILPGKGAMRHFVVDIKDPEHKRAVYAAVKVYCVQERALGVATTTEGWLTKHPSPGGKLPRGFIPPSKDPKRVDSVVVIAHFIDGGEVRSLLGIQELEARKPVGKVDWTDKGDPRNNHCFPDRVIDEGTRVKVLEALPVPIAAMFVVLGIVRKEV